MSIYVMVSATIRPGTAEAFESAFDLVRARVAGTPGHLGDQLLRHAGEQDRYTLLGHWESTEKFLQWEDAPVHREMTVPLRPYWAGKVDRTIYEITSADRVPTETVR
jgi:heme-degrading monooxygenase HmoA